MGVEVEVEGREVGGTVRTGTVDGRGKRFGLLGEGKRPLLLATRGGVDGWLW
jgi:hypothetical protein